MTCPRTSMDEIEKTNEGPNGPDPYFSMEYLEGWIKNKDRIRKTAGDLRAHLLYRARLRPVDHLHREGQTNTKEKENG